MNMYNKIRYREENLDDQIKIFFSENNIEEDERGQR